MLATSIFMRNTRARKEREAFANEEAANMRNFCSEFFTEDYRRYIDANFVLNIHSPTTNKPDKDGIRSRSASDGLNPVNLTSFVFTTSSTPEQQRLQQQQHVQQEQRISVVGSGDDSMETNASNDFAAVAVQHFPQQRQSDESQQQMPAIGPIGSATTAASRNEEPKNGGKDLKQCTQWMEQQQQPQQQLFQTLSPGTSAFPAPLLAVPRGCSLWRLLDPCKFSV
uniref:Uncharacterized protein n=1 Tax=Globodera rostochiensis TaxID=31243 RepID=A0A914HXS9_GLORO